jgi:hypothetical protein
MAQGKSPSSLRELGRQPFGLVADQWLTSRHDLKPRTRAEYENLLARRDRSHQPAFVDTGRRRFAGLVAILSLAGRYMATLTNRSRT